ncbi:MAG: hypothetical protein BGO41_15370 [Clostridiales bacterium 38-18]|nr:MAG: hypothetical protein BGO41_15370 [Clostridiales bacterium 38-18]
MSDGNRINIKLIKDDIRKFLKTNKAVIGSYSKRISDIFEISVYNSIVRYYQDNNYTVIPKNLYGNVFKYKLSPNGYPSNFSFFEVEKKIGKKVMSYEVRHNLTVESFHSTGIYMTPDISVIKKGSIVTTTPLTVSKTLRAINFVKSSDVISFYEAKNFVPFPELIFNFIGIVNELIPKCLKKTSSNGIEHIAPSIVISGKGNDHTDNIKKALETRYCINCIYNNSIKTIKGRKSTVKIMVK